MTHGPLSIVWICRQALSPAVQPRALWVVAHHLEVAAGMDATWMNLLRALAAALAGNDDLINSRRCAAVPMPSSRTIGLCQRGLLPLLMRPWHPSISGMAW